MQCVLLVGGLGTRLGPLVSGCPKPMLPVAGRPFLDHLLTHLRRFGLRRFLLLAGYRADDIAAHFAADPTVTVLAEPEPLGTGGALRLAMHMGALDKTFVMSNGDSFFDFNVLDLVVAHRRTEGLATMALRQVEDAARFGVVERDAGDRILRMRERPEGPGPGLINGGVYVIDRQAAEHLPDGPSSFERDLLPRLAAGGLLHGRLHDGVFIDIGVPEAYAEAQSLLPLRRPAVFFDRDGVLNRDAGYTHRPEDLIWMPGAPEAVRLCNDRGWFVFVVTNQAGVAHGLYDTDAIGAFHARMQSELAATGAHVDDFRYCPHHPAARVAHWRAACDWRKPGPGMILDLMRHWPVDPGRSFLVGDQDSDIAAARAAGIAGVLHDGQDLAALIRDRL